MIIVLKPGITAEEVDRVISRIHELGLGTDVSRGKFRTVIGVIGEEDLVRTLPLEALPGVEKVMPILSRYKLASREFKPQATVLAVKGLTIGGGTFCVIAGPCAVESRQMLFETARACRDAGAHILRGGAFKPRTSPYSFQGLGREALVMLKECADELNMPTVTEVMDPRDVELVARHADILQIGARNMQNFNLLTEAGASGKPVMLKRGLSASVEDLLMSAEYILSSGNRSVILCERGIKTFETSVRNSLDISSVPALRERTHLPIFVDPSHAGGHWQYVAPLARAALAAGADGIMVEVHPAPETALCDGPQQLRPEKFRRMMDQLRALDAVMSVMRAELFGQERENPEIL